MLNQKLGKKFNPISPLHIDREPSKISVDTIPTINEDLSMLSGSTIQSCGMKGDVEDISTSQEEDNDSSFLGVNKTQLLDVSSVRSKPKANPRRRMPTRTSVIIDVREELSAPENEEKDSSFLGINQTQLLL